MVPDLYRTTLRSIAYGGSRECPRAVARHDRTDGIELGVRRQRDC
jgi:hypothetical protein